ncbi:DMT family transporter [Streptosporangium sp. NPDC000396]|uniref:DMT family transporter n=1 Tax=Streptosporangium sp. NPDC000396 TaxID=3366185 RepID=UPI0036C50F0C
MTGAMVIATSATLVRLSDASPATSALFRCAYAVPFLGALAWREKRRIGPMAARERRLSWLAGAIFATDLLLWHHSIGYVGAGLATVLGNLQVFVVAFAAWAFLGERPPNRLLLAAPVVFAGVVLISGLFDAAPYGSDPRLGVILGAATSLAYAAFMLILRACSQGGHRGAGPLAHAVAAATVLIALTGLWSGGAVLTPRWPSHGWLLLLALGPQVLGWVLITYALPRQPAALTALLLLVQPAGTVALSALALAERPSAIQLAGCAVIALGVLYGSRPERRSRSCRAAGPANLAPRPQIRPGPAALAASTAAEQEAQVPKTSTV